MTPDTVVDTPASIVIVGAGAAGLTSAIAAATTLSQAGRHDRIFLLDGAKRIGAKILISGGGRCNVTHDVVTPRDFFGNRNIIRNALATFPVERAIAWFASLGVELKREPTGKLFPSTGKARTILTALIDGARETGVTICPDHRVHAIFQTTAGFLVQHSHGRTYASRLMLATGGRSLPKSGSDGFGYQLARELGHQITPTAPALVPLVLDRSMFHATLSGLSHEAELTTVVDRREVDRRRGSLLWTHVGISGPVVLDASRFWTLATKHGTAVELYGNFVPHQSGEELREWFRAQAAQHPKRSLVRTLSALVPDRFAESLCRHQACEPHTAVAQVPRLLRDRLLQALTRFPFPVIGDRGWNMAEVTAGGVPLEEINYRTMESKLVPGLYMLGELLDCDGRIGGFNFHWAWTTGWLAGEAAARSLLEDTDPLHRTSRLG